MKQINNQSIIVSFLKSITNEKKLALIEENKNLDADEGFLIEYNNNDFYRQELPEDLNIIFNLYKKIKFKSIDIDINLLNIKADLITVGNYEQGFLIINKKGVLIDNIHNFSLSDFLIFNFLLEKYKNQKITDLKLKKLIIKNKKRNYIFSEKYNFFIFCSIILLFIVFINFIWYINKNQPRPAQICMQKCEKSNKKGFMVYSGPQAANGKTELYKQCECR